MRKMKYSSLFGILALVLVLVLYLPFYVSAQLPIYFAWFAGVSLTAFIFYGLDKSLSKIQRFTVRVWRSGTTRPTFAGTGVCSSSWW
jgi:uncharacterized membrane protein YsdA (DUF1294 family)